MIKITLLVGALAIAVFLILLLIRLRYDRLVKERWRSLKFQPSGDIFSLDMIASLDEPVQRYFLHAIKPGTPLAASIELEMSGKFRLKPDADWLTMQAAQILSPSAGFIWKANVGKGLMQFSGADYYIRGGGRTKFSFWGLIPLVDAQTQDISRSGAGRLGAEYIWLPSALLPQNNVTWQAINNNTIQAKFELDHEPIVLTLTIDADGKLLEVSLPRWNNVIQADNWQYNTFIATITTEKTWAGYTIPQQLNAGWLKTNEYWLFFQSTILKAKFV